MVLSKIFVNNQDTGFEGIPLQQMGESTEMSMSQKAVTDVFNDIFEDFYVFSPRNASSSFKGGYSPTGEPIETQLETKIFTVVENEVIKIEATKEFSSPGFSIISVWSGDTFIESLVNSPKQLPININNYVVPIGANKIAITYVSDEIKVLGSRLITDNEPTENSNHFLTSGTLYNVTKFRGTIQNDDDVNSYGLLQGLWFTNGYNSNLPSIHIGLLVNQGIERIKYQLWFDLVSNSAYYRTCAGVGKEWKDWKNLDFVFYKGSLTSENNIDTMYSEAMYFGDMLNNKPSGTLPDGLISSYLLEITGTGGEILVQRLFVIERNQVWIRTKGHGTAWLSWRRLVVSTELDAINNHLVKSDSILYGLLDEVCNKTILPVASQITGVFSPTGESITSTIKTYFYTVSEGDLLNIDPIAFSSPGFSVVSVWNDDTFVESLINSPTTLNDGSLFYSVPNGVNKIAVSYGENKISKISAKTEEIEEQIAEVEEEVHQPTRNIWPLATDISYDNYLIFGEVGGPTIIPPGTYCFSYELVAAVSNPGLILYYDSGSVQVLYNVTSSNGRKTVVFTAEQNVTRVFFNFRNRQEGATAAFTNIQMEILDWKGYTSSPQKGDWAPLRYATPFIQQKTAVDKIAREYISYWTGKTINYNGDSVT
jgi:hypothetical protein